MGLNNRIQPKTRMHRSQWLLVYPESIRYGVSFIRTEKIYTNYYEESSLDFLMLDGGDSCDQEVAAVTLQS